MSRPYRVFFLHAGDGAAQRAERSDGGAVVCDIESQNSPAVMLNVRVEGSIDPMVSFLNMPFENV